MHSNSVAHFLTYKNNSYNNDVRGFLRCKLDFLIKFILKNVWL